MNGWNFHEMTSHMIGILTCSWECKYWRTIICFGVITKIVPIWCIMNRQVGLAAVSGIEWWSPYSVTLPFIEYWLLYYTCDIQQARYFSDIRFCWNFRWTVQQNDISSVVGGLYSCFDRNRYFVRWENLLLETRQFLWPKRNFIHWDLL